VTLSQIVIAFPERFQGLLNFARCCLTDEGAVALIVAIKPV